LVTIHLVKEFYAFYGTCVIITVYTRACYWMSNQFYTLSPDFLKMYLNIILTSMHRSPKQDSWPKFGSMIMNGKSGSLWKQLWPTYTYFPSIALKGRENPGKHSGGPEENDGKHTDKGFRKIRETDCTSLGLDSNPGPHEYETEVPTINSSNQAAYRHFSE
jgi:hypothetical protein